MNALFHLNLKKLDRFARKTPLHNSRLYHRLRFECKKTGCDKVIACFMGEVVSAERKKQTIKNMRHAMVRYHWDFEEYFLFDYEGLTHKERLMFVSEYDKNVFCDRVNNPGHAAIFYNKWKTYNAFKEYFKRDAILVTGLAGVDSEEVDAFVGKHQSFIMKPLYGSLGKGVKIIRATDKELAKMNLRSVLQEKNTECILEELIVQVDEMSRLHPESVNTVRIPTINYRDSVEIIHPLLRTGQGDSFVDNGGSGGIISAVNPENGEVIAAIDERLNEYTEHPNTHQPLVGFCIPRWNEAIDMAKEMAEVIPDVRYVSWDLALTENGWVVVEGNSRGALTGFQLPTHKGFRDELKDIYRRLQ